VRHPLVYVVFAYIAGILIADRICISFKLIYLSSVILLSGYFFFKKGLFLLLVFVFLGSFSFNINLLQDQPDNVRFFLPCGQVPVEITGTVIDDPDICVSECRSQIKINAEAVRPADSDESFQNITGYVHFNVYGVLNSGDYVYGDTVKARGVMFTPSPPVNPGEFDYSKYMHRKKVFCLVSVRPWKNEYMERIRHTKKNSFVAMAYRTKNRIIEIIYRTMPQFGTGVKKSLWRSCGLQSAFLEGILLGNERSLPEAVQRMFRNTGTAHILAVSGMNVAFLIMTLFFFLRLVYCPGYLTAFLGVILTIFYAFITSGQPSVARASIMAVSVLVARILERDPEIYNSLALSALVVLTFSPNDIFDIGFQLSYAAVFFLVYLSPKITPCVSFLPKWLAQTITATVSAQAGVIPILAYYFNSISIVSFLANLVIVPLVGIATALGFITGALGLVWLFPAKIIACANWLILTVMLAAVAIFSSLPYGSFCVPTPQWYLIVVYYLVLLSLFNWRTIWVSYKKVLFLFLPLVIVLFFLMVFRNKPGQIQVVTLRMQNSKPAYFVLFPDRTNMLVNAGPGYPENMGEKVILSFLVRKGIRHLDTVLVTDCRAGSCGGVSGLIGRIEIRQVLMPKAKGNPAKFRTFYSLVRQIHCSGVSFRFIEPGDKIEGYPAEIKISSVAKSCQLTIISGSTIELR